MIDKATALDTVLQKLSAMPVGHCLELRTYKRNRSVLFSRQGENSFLVLEEGFHAERFEDIPQRKLRKLFKILLKREFPRSTKIRLYTHGECDPEEVSRLDRKKL